MFRLDRDGEVARLTLDRPEARNAIPLQGWDALARLVEEVARSGARLLVLRGAGGAFCAGADLGDFASMRGDTEASGGFRLAMRGAIDRIAGLEIPVVAQIEGACYGAGVAIAIACDLRIASPASRFAITPAKIGLAYPQEDVHRLVSLVGPGQAARLLFTATSIDGEEAARIGLIELCEAGARIDLIAEAVVANAGPSLRTLKHAIRLAGLGQASDAEQDRCFDALASSDALASRLSVRLS